MENNLTKELAPLKTQVSQAVKLATALQIKTAEDEIKGADLLGKIKKVGAIIKAKKESITKPLNEALKNARDFFRPVESEWEQAENIVKSKLDDYHQKQIAAAAKQEEKIAAKVEAGKMSFEKASEKLAEVAPVKSVEAGAGAVQYRKVREVVLEDESKLPREYLVPDMVKIRKVALAGVEIPGVKVVDKQVVAGIVR